jgi:hypothetical protein
LQQEILLCDFPGSPLKLFQGALAMYGALSPGDLQHIHTSVGKGADGIKRIALMELRKAFEKNKYAGKV